MGAVRDTRFRSVRDPVAPMIFYDDGVYRYLAVRFETAKPNVLLREIEQIWRRHLPKCRSRPSVAEEKLAELYGADEARDRPSQASPSSQS